MIKTQPQLPGDPPVGAPMDSVIWQQWLILFYIYTQWVAQMVKAAGTGVSAGDGSFLAARSGDEGLSISAMPKFPAVPQLFVQPGGNNSMPAVTGAFLQRSLQTEDTGLATSRMYIFR